jgi:hypothetical protein
MIDGRKVLGMTNNHRSAAPACAGFSTVGYVFAN